ncbi:unnamed protein product [Rotaria sordida]|uniref:U-box domain-containing protein n=1 Tax=Rotaria sordida TaxID=392033 RepID=A0A819FCG0_9BILA|nr:unnamed protein product [Rotaria sordida]CAF3865716.1 unnamed protein product [Rotaria sordida]
MNTDPVTIIDHDDLICPITLEPYREPVIAADEHVYVRDAITIWISENGTSPFTRQPLHVEDPQPDNHMKYFAVRRRHLTMSYNVDKGTVLLSSSLKVSRTSTSHRSQHVSVTIAAFCGLLISLAGALSLALASGRSNHHSYGITTVEE